MPDPIDQFTCPATGAAVTVVVDPDAEPAGDLTAALARLLVGIDQREKDRAGVCSPDNDSHLKGE